MLRKNTGRLTNANLKNGLAENFENKKPASAITQGAGLGIPGECLRGKSSFTLYAIIMKKSIAFTVFLLIAFVALLVARILFEYYSNVVPALGALLTTFTWLTVGAGVLALVFVVVILIKLIRSKE